MSQVGTQTCLDVFSLLSPYPRHNHQQIAVLFGFGQHQSLRPLQGGKSITLGWTLLLPRGATQDTRN